MSLLIAGWDPSRTFDHSDTSRATPRRRGPTRPQETPCATCRGGGLAESHGRGVVVTLCPACLGSGKDTES